MQSSTLSTLDKLTAVKVVKFRLFCIFRTERDVGFEGQQFFLPPTPSLFLVGTFFLRIYTIVMEDRRLHNTSETQETEKPHPIGTGPERDIGGANGVSRKMDYPNHSALSSYRCIVSASIPSSKNWIIKTCPFWAALAFFE